MVNHHKNGLDCHENRMSFQLSIEYSHILDLTQKTWLVDASSPPTVQDPSSSEISPSSFCVRYTPFDCDCFLPDFDLVFQSRCLFS